MICWLWFLCFITQRSSIAYPDYYSMQEENPYINGPNGDENYADYSDPRFDPQLYPWKLNTEPESHRSEKEFGNSGINSNSNEEKTKDSAAKSESLHHRNGKFKNTLKTERPSKMSKPYHYNRQQVDQVDGKPTKMTKPYNSNKQQEVEQYPDYEMDEEIQNKRDIAKNQLSPITTSEENSLYTNKNIANRYHNKRNDVSLGRVYMPENSQNEYIEVAKNGYQLESGKRSSDALRTVEDISESVDGNNFNGNGLEDDRGIMYTTDETLSNGPEFIPKIKNQNNVMARKTEKRDYFISGGEQSLRKNPETASDNGDEYDYMESSSLKPNSDLILLDTTSEYDQQFLTQFYKTDKNPNALKKSLKSQAAPKLTFFNDNQSSTEFQDRLERNEFTSESTTFYGNRRMINGKGMMGRQNVRKPHKSNYARNSLSHYSQKLETKDKGLYKPVNHKIERQNSKSGKTREASKRMFKNTADNRVSGNYQIQGKVAKKSINLRNANSVSNQKYVKRNLRRNSANSFKPKPLNNKNLYSSNLQIRRNSAQDAAIEPYLSNSRPVEISEFTTEIENAIRFEKNDYEDGAPYTLEIKENQISPKPIVRNSNKYQTRKRMDSFNRHSPTPIANLPSFRDSHRKSLEPSNPYYANSQSGQSSFDPKGPNRKRVPEIPRASGVEIDQLSQPDSYGLNIAKSFNSKKAKVDEKLSRTVEDHKVKETILKDGNNSKETDIIENEKVVNNVYVIKTPNKVTPIPPSELVENPFLPENPINPSVDQDKLDDSNISKEQGVESDNGNLNISPKPRIDVPPGAEAEESDQNEPSNAPTDEYYEEENKENGGSEDFYDSNENEAHVESTQAATGENYAATNVAGPDGGSESSQEEYSNYDNDYNDGTKKSALIPPEENRNSMKVAHKYLPPADNQINSLPDQAPTDDIQQPPPGSVFQNVVKNGMYRQKYKLPHGKGNKHKKIYHFSTEYAVSGGMDEFEKEEKLEKASKTVVRNKLMTANESSHHFQEKKTEIKNNKESYHESLIEEKDESKFPRDMDNSKSYLQRSVPTANNNIQLSSEDYRNSYPYSDSAYLGSSASDNNLESVGEHEYDNQPPREYSGRISERYSPPDELKLNEDFIDDLKRSQPSLKIVRDANTISIANETSTQDNPQDGRRDASSPNGESNQEMQQQSTESNSGGSSNMNKDEIVSKRAARESITPSWTPPYSESKSGNVVYITMRTTTVDSERKYHDFIQIHNSKRNVGRFERHPRHYIRKRKKNRNTANETFGP